jgi:hypothetical protein
LAPAPAAAQIVHEQGSEGAGARVGVGSSTFDDFAADLVGLRASPGRA